MSEYVPDRGDLIWLEFDPQAGREQAGRRPALVLSPRAYNERSSLALVCPITSKTKGYPFEVVVEGTQKITGAILCVHLKSADWRRRKAVFVERLEPNLIADVVAKILPLIEEEW